jgi:protein involved in polysaccharide export with SLBB domain
MRRISLWLFLVVVFQTQVFGQSPPGVVMLEPGDKVMIEVWQRPELSGEFNVGLDGRILHPLYQNVRVTGVPADQIEGMVREFLSRFEADPQVVVQPMMMVAVVGAVNTPGVQSVPPGATVGQAVGAAGGVSATGEFDDVLLRRKNGDETEIDLREGSSWSTPVRSGDQVTVEEKGQNTFREIILPVMHFGLTIVNFVNILILR